MILRIGLRVALAALLAVCATAAGAQEETGRIEGRVVRGEEGVATVVVLISELGTAEVTDADGRFAFENVPTGTYTLIFTLGDKSEARPNVIVTAGRTHELTLEVEWQVVTERVRVTAAERAAKIVDAPAAVTAIPETQIEKQASHGQVPKILEFTPGAEVTQSGLYDFNFNTRGFNSSLNRRVSTYIDGRDVGVVLLGAQEWAAIAGGLDDVASLEFIRGPSAALYGANASSGVINITTKAPRDSVGTMVRVASGGLDTQSIDFRSSQPMPGGWYSKAVAGMKNSGDFTISRDDVLVVDPSANPEYSVYCENVGLTDCLPREKTLLREQDNEIRFGSLRFDRYLPGDQLLTLEAGASVIRGPVFQTGIGRVQNLVSTRPFFRVAWSKPHWNVLAHHSYREGNQVNLNQALVDDELITDTKRSGIEVQGHWSVAGDRGRFVIGAAHTEEKVDTYSRAARRQTVVYEPIESDRQAIFSQFDWKVNDAFKLVFAGRIDESTLHDTQFSPKLAAVYSFNANNSVRLTFNKAFQVANYSEFFLHARLAAFPIGGFVRAVCESPALPMPVDCGIEEDFIPILAVGNDDLELEKTSAWEIGYSGLLGDRFFLTIDYYNSKNRNFITDLIRQVGTNLGIAPCVDAQGNTITDPTRCPVNPDYIPWVSTPEAENTFIFGDLTVAQALRNSVDRSVGGSTLGFRLAQDLDGSTVVVGRTYTNVGNVDTQGVDLGMQFFFSEAWSLQASYSWFDFQIPAENQDIEDILLPNSPEHKASLSVSFARDRWSASVSGRWVDEFRWAAGVFQGNVPSYETIDVNAGVQLTRLMALGVNVANATDSIHRQTFGGDLLRRRALVNLTFKW